LSSFYMNSMILELIDSTFQNINVGCLSGIVL